MMKKNTIATALGGLAISVPWVATAGDLPVPAVNNWVGAGQATGVVSGNTFDVNQASQSVSLNWQSFNIGADSTVNFHQPSSSSVALNRIFQADPASIRGALNANGEVYLLSQNGIIFGSSAQVNVRGLIASSLNISLTAENFGLRDASIAGEPAFAGALGADGKPVAGDIRVEGGARITTPSGGRVFMFAPNVSNEGTIKTPDGQTALAAGNKIYLTASDSSIRGLVVEVDQGGTVTNGNAATAATPAGASIQADHGNVSLIGLAVNQLGRVSASTAIRSGGSIRLIARESSGTASGPQPLVGGTLTLGAGSVTEANPDLDDKELTLDANVQPKGKVTLVGNEIFLRSDSRVSAKSGTVELRASSTGNQEIAPPVAGSASRIYLERGSVIDVSGEFVDLPADRNALTVRLQGAELRDSPVQRDSAVKGQLVTVDVRRHGTTADGRTWIGTPLADLTEAAQGVKRSVGERNTAGGSVNFGSEGEVILAQGATVDVSGGGVNYAGGAVQTTLLVRQGAITDIGSADPNVAYDGIFGSTEVVHARWGVVEEYQSAFVNGVGTGGGPGAYFEGADAGALQLYGTRLVLDASLFGGVTRGEFQRSPTTTFTGTQRPGDQVPRGGQMTVGYVFDDNTIPDFGLSSARFGIQPVLPGIPAFDPLHDPMPELPADVTIPVGLFGEGKFSSLTLAVNGSLELPAGVQLNLGPGGVLNTTSGEVSLGGQIIARGGTVSMLTRNSVDVENSGGRMMMASTAGIDVSGLWTNDTRDPKAPPMPFDRLQIDAGSIRLEAREFEDDTGGLILERGSRLDADGGAYVTAGRVTAGRGGGISVLARRGLTATPVEFTMDADLSAYGLEQGGALAIQASDVCLAATLCAGMGVDTTAWFTPGYLRNAGFRSYSFTADGGTLAIPENTRLDLQQVNRVLDGNFLQRADRADIDAFTHLATLPDIQRKPVDLSLGVRLRISNSVGEIDADLFRTFGILDIGNGALINADPGARISLSSDTRMFVDGTISAPAGAISLSLESAITGARFGEFIPAQSLWLGGHAALLAPGATRIVEDGFGRRTGSVLAAGSVGINARSGYVVAESGSRIDVSGVTGELDITPSAAADPFAAPVRTVVAADAGSINIRAAEGILLASDLDGAAATAGARAGSLTIELDANERNLDSNPERPPASLGVPETPRTIVVSHENIDDAIDDLTPGDPVDDRLNSYAFVDPNRVAAGEFGDLTLRAASIGRGSNAPGRIRFDGDVSLSASRRLTLDAAGIESNGGRASVSAPYVIFGNQNLGRPTADNLLPDFVDRFGALTVSGDFIDIIGSTRLLGLHSTQFSSTGDIRLRGIQFGTDIDGLLESTGDLKFSARQIYAPTLNDFNVRVRDNPEGRIVIDAVGTPAPVLSVGSQLQFEAPDILQGGVIKAPLGEIVLNASRDLTLERGSLTSTSLENSIVPFGRVEVGTDWVYGLDAAGSAGVRLVFTEQSNRPADELPRQRVELKAPSVTLSEGSVIDQTGGGDLQAYEFQSGLTGSFDVLNPSVAPGNYAIVPLLASGYAPIDPQESLQFGLKAGESVELASSLPGLPAGRYALLPARYALLPGAYLVTAVGGYSDLAPGAVLPYAQGGSVLAGRRVFADGHEGDSRTSGFVIRTQTDIAKLARYDIYRANTFATGFAGQLLPRDAGATRVEAGLNLELGGSIRSAGAAGGRGSTVEITGEQLAVVADRDDNTADEGALLLDADGLNALGAESLILGGTRSFGADGATLTVSSRQIEVDEGAKIKGAEVILAATDSLRVEQGASVSGEGASGAQLTDLTVHGDGALLRVSSAGQGEFLRTDSSGASGVLQIDAGATIGAAGSTLLSGAQNVSFNGALDMDGGSLALDTGRINLGIPEDSTTPGFTLTAQALANLGVDELRLSARDGIDINEALDVGIQRIAIRAPRLTGHLASGERARFDSDEFSMANLAPAADAAEIDGQGAPVEPGSGGMFEVTARQIALGGGEYAVAGFDSVRLAATDTLRAAHSDQQGAVTAPPGRLSVDGSLNLSAAAISGDDNANLAIIAGGAVRIDASGNAPLPASLSGLGARVSIEGSAITDAGRIDLRGGLLQLHASGAQAGDGIIVAQGATISVAGVTEKFDEQDAYVPAGEVKLSADHGSVDLQSGSLLDVSGSGAGDAGRLEIRAAEGSATLAGDIHAAAASGALGAAVSLDVQSLEDFSTLNQALESAGFARERSLRVRSGDILVAAGDSVRAGTVSLTADAGSIEVAGHIDASGAKAGSIALNAGDQIAVQNGATLTARATEAGNRGGEIALRASTGGVLVEQGAKLDVTALPAAGETAAAATSARGGSVAVRVTRDVALTLADADSSNDTVSLSGDIVGARRVDLEAYARYTDSEGEIDAGDVSGAGNPRFDEAVDFIAQNGAAIRTGLGANGTAANFHLLPGIEIVTDENAPDLHLSSTWDLSNWRFNGEAGVLTLRAAGSLFLDASLSDGFNGVRDLTTNVLPVLRTDDSWSYRLVAGADGGSADPLATSVDPAAGGILLAPGTISEGSLRPKPIAVRTGTGTIELAAAGDITLGNRAAVIYTAGRDTGEGIRLGGVQPSLQNRAYPQHGGDISVSAGGAVRGVSPDLRGDLTAYGNQLITPWLFRTGASDESAFETSRRPTGWTVAFERFEQGIGALGGGNVSVDAGGDLDNLSISIPSIGMQVGGTKVDASVVRIVGGGDLTVRAADDILGGVFFVGKGDADIRAGGSVLSGRVASDVNPFDVHTFLALGDGRITLSARGRIDIEGVVNPTLLPLSNVQHNPNTDDNSFFSTYGDQSAVKVTSTAGDIRFVNTREPIAQSEIFGLVFDTLNAEDAALIFYPPKLEATSFRGDISFGSMSLYPSPSGDVQFLADKNVIVAGDLTLSDLDPSDLGTVEHPAANFAEFADRLQTGQRVFGAVPIHANDPDTNPARIIARTGDINVVAPNAFLFIPKKAEFTAGRDIVGLNTLVQNLHADDVTVLAAGRDLIYPALRDPNGNIFPSSSGVDIQGPGRLLVQVGRNIDLGASNGISSLGDTSNAALADQGADIILIGGLNGHAPQLAAFADKYDVAADLPVVLDKFYDILRVSGRRNAALPNDQRSYADAFDAIKILFPATDYTGSMDMFFSRVYTLDGGDIDVLMPGGGVNVGLAAPPSSFGVTKVASQLGMVAQSFGSVRAFLDQNFEINESRVFAADGGDILVWSSNGDIDAGRGAKTSISAPPPIINVDPVTGAVSVSFPPALTGSGIRTLTSTPGRPFGSVDLFTPRGVVDASEAGIETLGNLTIAAVEVLGTQNIKVGGVSTGVPVDTGGLAASLSAVSSVGSSAAAATAEVASGAGKSSQAPMADSAMSFLEVFVLGFGEGVCDSKDLECLKRQEGHAQ
jgi:filamentous hemagglutinin